MVTSRHVHEIDYVKARTTVGGWSAACTVRCMRCVVPFGIALAPSWSSLSQADYIRRNCLRGVLHHRPKESRMKDFTAIHIHLHVERMCRARSGIRVRMRNDTWPDNNRCVMPGKSACACLRVCGRLHSRPTTASAPCTFHLADLLQNGQAVVAEFTCLIDIRPRLANCTPH